MVAKSIPSPKSGFSNFSNASDSGLNIGDPNLFPNAERDDSGCRSEKETREYPEQQTKHKESSKQ